MHKRRIKKVHCFTLSDGVYEELKGESERMGVSMSIVVGLAVDEYVARKEKGNGEARS